MSEHFAPLRIIASGKRRAIRPLQTNRPRSTFTPLTRGSPSTALLRSVSGYCLDHFSFIEPRVSGGCKTVSMLTPSVSEPANNPTIVGCAYDFGDSNPESSTCVHGKNYRPTPQ